MNMEKKPFITLEQAKAMIEQYPTPFHLYDEKGFVDNVRRLKQAFSWNKGYKEYFAVKATPNPYLMDILKEEGVGADCSSYTELMLADAIGVSGSDIMFSSNVTPREDFALAAKMGAIINFDDINHIDFFGEIAEFPETMSCRYNPGGDFTLKNQIMDTPQEAKYGFTYDQMVEGFLKLKEKGVKHFGIHAFLASNTVTDDYYPKLAKILFQTAVDLRNKTGVHIAFINLSGGVGIPYTVRCQLRTPTGIASIER
jgi:diaminopimelate decarboxylase